jgi:ankyrin repeat protein
VQGIESKEMYELLERSLDEDEKRFFKLFTESTFEGRRAVAREMKKIVVRQTKHNPEVLLFHSLYLLIHTKSEKLILWPNSPLLVLLRFADPNMLTGDEHDEIRTTLFDQLAILADPTSIDYSTQENQLTLGRQLIEHGANVNVPAVPYGDTPLHTACHSDVTTNLHFIQLLLENGADPNAQEYKGLTPLMCTTMFAPGAAKFLLEWPTTDVNIIDRSGISFRDVVRGAIEHLSNQVALPDNPDRVKHQFVLQQWREIKEMLVERGRRDTGIADLE